MRQELRAKRKAGEKLKNKGSGFGGKGFKFDEAEQKRLTDAAAKTKKLLLIQNGEEVSEEEDAAAAAGDAGDDFEEQAANLNAQYHQKVPLSPLHHHCHLWPARSTVGPLWDLPLWTLPRGPGWRAARSCSARVRSGTLWPQHAHRTAYLHNLFQ